MHLLKRMSCLYRFTKPMISRYKSMAELEHQLKMEFLNNIKTINAQKLKNNKFYTVEELAIDTLGVSKEVAKQIKNSSVYLSAHNAQSNESFTFDYNMSKGLVNQTWDKDSLQFPFMNFNNLPEHFTLKRGAAIIPTIQLKPHSFYLFNLPDNITVNEIKNLITSLKVQNAPKIQQVHIGRCVLGLPAYAEVVFEKDHSFESILQQLTQDKLTIENRTMKVKTEDDNFLMQQINRRLVIQLDNVEITQFLFHASKYGRIIHIDFPHMVCKLPNIDDVKEHYKDYDGLIKINTIYPDGKIQSEYFPDKDILTEDQLNPDINMFDKINVANRQYERRMQFAESVYVYYGEDGQVDIKSKQYCVLTFSTPQQCQCYYFGNAYKHRIHILGTKHEFQFDTAYKKAILRSMDNSHLRNMMQAIKNSPQDFDSPIETKLVLQGLYNQSFQKHPQQNQNQFQNIRDIKRTAIQIRQQENFRQRKTFNQLAEEQLYGQIIPKQEPSAAFKTFLARRRPNDAIQIAKNCLDSPIQQITTSYFKQIDGAEKRTRMSAKYLKNPNLDKDLKIRKSEREQTQQRKFESMMQKRSKMRKASRQEQQMGMIEQPLDDGHDFDGNDPRYSFSTTRNKQIYRPWTPAELANYNISHNQFIRNNLNDYLGISRDTELQDPFRNQICNLLNPYNLQFSGGLSILQEDSLEDILQYHRNYKVAQKEYETYFKTKEILAFKSISVPQLRHKAHTMGYKMQQYLTDFGLIEQAIPYEQENKQNTETNESTNNNTEGTKPNEQLLKKVKILNQTQAGFGQHFTSETINGKDYIVKVAKLDHIYPLDRINHIQKYLKTQGKALEGQKLPEVPLEVMDEIYKTGIIPDAICEAFGIPLNTTLDDVFEQAGGAVNLSKKDLQMLLRSSSYSDDQIRADIAQQIEIEKCRAQHRQTNTLNYAKDPSSIATRNQSGFFQVSKFRQI